MRHRFDGNAFGFSAFGWSVFLNRTFSGCNWTQVVETEIPKWLKLIINFLSAMSFFRGIIAYRSESLMSSPCPNIEPTNFGWWNIVLDPDLSSFHTGIPRIPVSHKKLGGHYLARRNQPNSKSSGKFPPGATGCHVQDVWCGVRGAPLAPLRHVNSRRIQWGNNRGTHPSETPQGNRKPASLLKTRHPSRSYMQIWKESRWVLIYCPLSSKRSWSLGFPGGGVRCFPPNRLSLWTTKSTYKKQMESEHFERSNLFQYIHCKGCVLYILLCWQSQVHERIQWIHVFNRTIVCFCWIWLYKAAWQWEVRRT